MVAAPLSGKRVYLDSNPIIYAFENPHAFPGLATHLLAPLSRGDLTAVTSTITLTEVLTHPIKSGDSVLENAYRRFLTPTRTIEIISVDSAIAEHAAALRAKFGLRTPDAIHVSTCLLTECDIFLSRDHGLRKLGVNTISPEDISQAAARPS